VFKKKFVEVHGRTVRGFAFKKGNAGHLPLADNSSPMRVYPKKARLALRQKGFALTMLPEYFVTLTYCRHAKRQDVTHHIDLLNKRFRYRYPFGWALRVLEPTNKGRAHLHLVLSSGIQAPEKEMCSWLQTSWMEIAGQTAPAGGIDILAQVKPFDPNRFDQAICYITKPIHQDRKAKNPTFWDNRIKHWGVMQEKNLPVSQPEFYAIDDKQHKEVMSCIDRHLSFSVRKYSMSKHKKMSILGKRKSLIRLDKARGDFYYSPVCSSLIDEINLILNSKCKIYNFALAS